MTNLKEIQGFNIYCGPGVLAALTGKSTDQCAAVISAVSGKREIKAVQVEHLCEAARRLDMDVTEHKNFIGYTLFSIIHSLLNIDGLYIINVPRHVIALEIKDKKVYFIDNHTKTAIDAASSARLMQRVERAFVVKPKPQPTQEDLISSRIEILQREIVYLQSRLEFINSQITTKVIELDSLTRSKANA